MDLDAVFKFLDTAGNKLDYRRYGEVLLEILVAGGLLAPGGSFQNEGGDKPAQTRACVFQDAFDIDRVKAWDQQVFVKLMRRFKYLEKMLVEEMKKILVYLKGFTDVSACQFIITHVNLIIPGAQATSGSTDRSLGLLRPPAPEHTPGHHQ